LQQTLAESATRLAEGQRQTDAQAQAKLALEEQRTAFEARLAEARYAVREASQHQQSLAVQLEAAANQARHAAEQRQRLQARQEQLARRTLDLQTQLTELLAPLPVFAGEAGQSAGRASAAGGAMAQARTRIASWMRNCESCSVGTRVSNAQWRHCVRPSLVCVCS